MSSDGIVDMAGQTSTFASVATKVTTYGGSAGAVFFGLTANEMAAIGGLATAVLGLLVTVIFKLRDDRRAAQRHAAEMRRFLQETEHHG